jgi:hypothetical protein
MVVFLANRANLQQKRLHDRIQNRLSGEFDAVRRRRAEPREAGPYRVVGETNPRQYFGDKSYPATEARIEVGFQLRTGDPHEYYWINWIEPARNVLVGWHQDDTHADLGPVHLQVNNGSSAVAHQSTQFIDSHPLDVVAQRITTLPDAVSAVEWENGRPVGFDTSATVIK